MLSKLFILTSVFHSYLVFAAPHPITAADSGPVFSLTPINMTAVGCSETDPNCATKRSLQKRQIFQCPPNYRYGGGVCVDPVTRGDVCISTLPGDDDEQVFPQACSGDWVCLATIGSSGMPVATCEPGQNTKHWVFQYPSDTLKIVSNDPNTPSQIVINYYGPNNAPIKVAYTGFVGQAYNENDGAAFGVTTAVSNFIDWTYDPTILVNIEETSTVSGINIVGFLSA